MRSLDVDYVLVVFGGVTGYSSDDINKKGTRWSPIAFNKTKNKHIPKPSTHSRSSPKERSGNFQSSSVTKFKHLVEKKNYSNLLSNVEILLDMNRMLSFLCFSKIEGLELLMGVIYLVPMHLQNLMEVVMWHWFIEPILGLKDKDKLEDSFHEALEEKVNKLNLKVIKYTRRRCCNIRVSHVGSRQQIFILAKWMEPKSIKDKDERKRKQKFSGYWEQMQEMPKLFIGEVGHTKVEGNLKFLLTREKKNEHSANGGRRAMYLQTCRTSFFHVHSY
ncbi:unnamed protein product [Lactuca saligna]|uniref:Uncharacterized protein n=1 Tax=Lactuca saligna TaxID=75948 RepID=A0AA35ZLK1_LACSI|nr:unnamed protein product [Lactuca saligna]